MVVLGKKEKLLIPLVVLLLFLFLGFCCLK
jgi:hypothetical protein